MAVDWSRVPVVVGAGQLTNRDEDPLSAPDPFELMAGAAGLALAAAPGRTAGGLSDPGRLTHCWTVHSLSLRHGDPAAELARRIGAAGAATRCSGMGGSIPQWLVNRAAELVAAGERPTVLIVGAEALATRRRAKKAGIRLEWPSAEGWPDTWPPIEGDLGVHPVERAHGLEQATTMYALLESAVAHGAGHDPATQRRAIGRLMARFNQVAVGNPHSWFATPRSADEIVTVGPDNRMVNFPYPKYVNAVMDVDMAAAVVVTDAQTARDAGLGPDDVAYLSGWADAHDIWYLSERPSLERSPALAQCLVAASASAAVSIDDVAAFDLYACFPSSIEVARDSFGVSEDDPRPLTLTGGLPYHGGPGSNYVTHSIANTFDAIRAGTVDTGLVHGNGYYLTKHSIGIYRATPPAAEPTPDDGLQDRILAACDPLPVDATLRGDATVVAYTVPFDRDGAPEAGVLVVEGGQRRTVARADRALTAALLETDGVGLAVTLSDGPDGTNLASPR